MITVKTHLDSCGKYVKQLELAEGFMSVPLDRNEIMMLWRPKSLKERRDFLMLRQEISARLCEDTVYSPEVRKRLKESQEPIVDPPYYSPLELLLHRKGIDIARPYMARVMCDTGELMFYQNPAA